jgi:CAAX protease family protein
MEIDPRPDSGLTPPVAVAAPAPEASWAEPNRLPDPVPQETSPPAVAPRPRWHPLLRSVLFLVAFIVVQGAATYAVYLAFQALGAVGVTHERALALRGEAVLSVFLLAAPLLVLVTKLFVRYLDRSTLADLGARWPAGGRRQALRQALLAPLAAVALPALWLALLAAVAHVRIAGWSREFVAGTPGGGRLGGVLRLLLLLLGFLVQGGVEEWVVRGYVYHALKERWRWWVAALASSVLFSLLHGLNPDVTWIALVNIVLAGFVLALLVERSGSLWSAVLAHGVWNFALACLLSLPVSGLGAFRLLDVSVAGPAALTGGGFGPEGSLLLTPLGVALVAVLWPRRRAAQSLQSALDPSGPAASPSPLEGGKGIEGLRG